MIVVTSVRTSIAIEVIEGGIFDPDQSAILKMAYDRAANALIKDYDLSESAKTKLAKTVLRMGRVTLASVGHLSIEPDVQNIASAASIHLLSLSADQANRLLTSAPLFQVAAMRPLITRDGDGRPGEGEAAFLSLVTNV